MKRLAAIIAGGASKRFGSDKAAALFDEKPLIEHAIDGLSGQADELVIVGRAWKDWNSIPDFPRPDGGPLFGLCAALNFARENGFDDVLTAGCDTLPVPHNLAEMLSPGPAVIDGHWLFGLWNASQAEALAMHIEGGTDRALRTWVRIAGARRVECATQFRNCNTPADIA